MSTPLYIAGGEPAFLAAEYPTVRTCHFHDRFSAPGQSFDTWPEDPSTARFMRYLTYSTPGSAPPTEIVMADREDAFYLAAVFGVGANMGDGRTATAAIVKEARQWFRRALRQMLDLKPSAMVGWYGFPIVWNYDHTLYNWAVEQYGFLAGSLVTMFDGFSRVALLPSFYDQRTGQSQVDPNDDWPNNSTWQEFIDEGMRNALRLRNLCSPALSLYPLVSDKLFDVTGDPNITDRTFVGDYAERVISHSPDGLVYWNENSASADAEVRATLDVLVEVCA